MHSSNRPGPRLAAITVLVIIACAAPAHAAEFGFQTFIRLGAAGSDWEFSAANPGGASPLSGSLGDYWASGASREFQVIYQRPTNSLQLRLYANNGSSYTSLNSSPAGAPGAADAVWRLPASSFFVTALTGANVWTGVTVSNITLSGLSGALDVLSPVQQTWMQAGSSQWQSTQSVSQSQDIVFRGDATGSWRLAGFVTMNFWGLGGSGHQDRLLFGVSALSDSSAPEPSTAALMMVGLAVAAGWRHRRKSERQLQP